MTQARNLTTLLIAMSFAFILGWTSRGDFIYGKMFANMVSLTPDLGKK